MRALRTVWLASAVLTVVAACAPPAARYLTGPSGAPADSTAATQGATIWGTVKLASPAFAVKAAAKTVGDITSITYQLWNVPGATVAATYTTTATTFKFVTVPDGTYQLKAEAFGAGPVSITQGGPQTSSNTATVSAPNVNYSAGTSLAVTMNLLNGTGETINNSATVNNGTPWAGSPVGAP